MFGVLVLGCLRLLVLGCLGLLRVLVLRVLVLRMLGVLVLRVLRVLVLRVLRVLVLRRLTPGILGGLRRRLLLGWLLPGVLGCGGLLPLVLGCGGLLPLVLGNRGLSPRVLLGLLCGPFTWRTGLLSLLTPRRRWLLLSAGLETIVRWLLEAGSTEFWLSPLVASGLIERRSPAVVGLARWLSPLVARSPGVVGLLEFSGPRVVESPGVGSGTDKCCGEFHC